MIEPHVWYDVKDAESAPALSCYRLKLYLIDDRIIDGYYYDHRLWHEDKDVTSWTDAWMIDTDGEVPHAN